MPDRLVAHLLAGLALAGSGTTAAMMNERRPARSTDLPRPRDGNVAIQEELHAARRAATLEAYELFLARHPGHPLAGAARREVQRLTAESGQ